MADYNNTTGKKNITITGSDEADTIINRGDNVTIVAKLGADSIFNYGSTQVSIFGDANNNNKGGDTNDGNDYIYNEGNGVRIYARGGADSIFNSGSNVYPSGDDGDDLIISKGKNNTPGGQAGNDTIYNGYTYDENSMLPVSASGDESATVYGGEGDDLIFNTGSKASVMGEAGADSITNYGSQVTINGGSGNDSINNSGDKVVFKYQEFYGNDKIIGFNENSTLEVTGRAYTRDTVGNDVVFNFDNGSITLSGATSLSAIHLKQDIKEKFIRASDIADSIQNTLEGVTIQAFKGNDTIDNTADNVSIDGGDDADNITNSGANVTITGGNGNDFITNSGSNVTIEGGDGNDTITNSGTAVSILGGAGVDSIINYGNKITIDGGAGNTTVENHGNVVAYVYNNTENVTLKGFSRTDTIVLTTASIASSIRNDNGVTLTLDNNKTILLQGYGSDPINTVSSVQDIATYNFVGNSVDNTLVTGDESGTNYITNSGSNVTINSGAGNDSIYNAGDNVIFQYDLGDGNDTIWGFKANSTLSLASGSVDSVYFADSAASITIGGAVLTFNDFTDGDALITVVDADGNKKTYSEPKNIVNNRADTLITTGDESDTIENQNQGTNVTINSNAGDDLITNYAASATINAGAGNNTLVNGEYFYSVGADVLLNGGEGDEVFSNNGVNALINGDAGNDLLLNGFSYYKFPDTVAADYSGKTYFYDTNSSSVESGGDYSTVLGGAGNDTIGNHGTSATISGEAGDDYIYNGYGYNTDATPAAFYAVNAYTGDYSAIDGGDGSDKIFNQGYGVLINGGADADSVFNHGNNATIDGGAGNDSLINGEYGNRGGEYVSITGGAGVDTIISHGSNSTLEGGDGNDRIYNGYTYNSNTNTLFASTLEGYVGDKSYVDGGAGNDTINSYGSNVTIAGGAGNDAINIASGKNNVIQFNTGDGSDTIYNFGNTDSIKINDGTTTFASLISGSDLILYSGEDSITILDAGYLSSINVIGSTGSNEETSFVNNNSSATVNGTTKNIISFGRTKAVYIIGNAYDNSIVGGTAGDTIDGAAGNDTITGGRGNDLFVYSGGADVITDYGTGGDNISLSGAKISGVDIDGNDVVLTFDGGGSLTIQDGYKVKKNDKVTSQNKVVTFLEEKSSGYSFNSYVFEQDQILNSKKTEIILLSGTTTFDGTEKANSKIKTIDGSAVTGAISIQGSNSANKIYAGDHGSTLNGGKGNDTLYGGDGADIFLYEAKQGNDVIYNYAAGDTISLSGQKAEISKVTLKKKDIVFKVGSKKLTVKEASTTEITLDENGTTKIYSGGLLYDANKTSASVTAAYATKTKLELDDLNINAIDAASATKGVNIVGSSSADTLLGSNKKDTIAGYAGADYLSGGKGNDSMKGGDGNDTLVGGKGKDSLWGNDGADTFIYAKGDGKDIIYGFDEDDLLQITGGTVNLYYTSRKEISVKVGSTTGAITLKDFGSTDTFHVNDDTWVLSDGTLKKA